MSSPVYISWVVTTALLTLGVLSPAVAQDAFSRTGAFVIPVSDVAQGLGHTSCTDRNYDAPVDASDLYADRDLRLATCILHDVAARTIDWEATTALLARLQTRGLPPAQQSFAALSEGILHCRIAHEASRELMPPEAYETHVNKLRNQINEKRSAAETAKVENQAEIDRLHLSLQEISDSDKRGEINAKINELQESISSARTEIENLEWSMEARTLARTRFCAAREMAYASFREVDWTRLQFSYDKDDDNARLNGLMGMYRHCFIEDSALAADDERFPPLGAEGNNQCDIIAGLNEDQRKDVIDDVLGTKNPNKITDHESGLFNTAFGARSRITAMFASKKSLADQLTTDFEAEINKLKDKSQALGKAFCRLSETIRAGDGNHCPGQPNTVDAELAKSFLPYKNTYALADALDDTRERWTGGMLISGNKNFAQEIQGPSAKFEDGGVLAKIAQARDGLSTQTTVISDLASRISNIIDREDIARRRVAAMCVHFYCEIVPAGESLDGYSAYDAACAAPDLAGNEMCMQERPIAFSATGGSGSNSTGDTTRHLTAICEQAGVDPKYLNLTLNRIEAKECRINALDF